MISPNYEIKAHMLLFGFRIRVTFAKEEASNLKWFGRGYAFARVHLLTWWISRLGALDEVKPIV